MEVMGTPEFNYLDGKSNPTNMNLTLDSCSSISANGSNSTSAMSTDSSPLCAVLFYTASIMMPVFVLPFNIWALYLGRRTVTSDGGSASSDTLILNMVSTCVIVCLTYTLLLINSTYMIQSLAVISMLFDTIGSMSQVQFQSWISVEHCLAVVFPVFYLKFKQHRYRLVWIGFTWVTSLLYGGLMVLLDSAATRLYFIIPFFVMLTVILVCNAKATHSRQWEEKRDTPSENKGYQDHYIDSGRINHWLLSIYLCGTSGKKPVQL